MGSKKNKKHGRGHAKNSNKGIIATLAEASQNAVEQGTRCVLAAFLFALQNNSRQLTDQAAQQDTQEVLVASNMGQAPQAAVNTGHAPSPDVAAAEEAVDKTTVGDGAKAATGAGHIELTKTGKDAKMPVQSEGHQTACGEADKSTAVPQGAAAGEAGADESAASETAAEACAPASAPTHASTDNEERQGSKDGQESGDRGSCSGDLFVLRREDAGWSLQSLEDPADDCAALSKGDAEGLQVDLDGSAGHSRGSTSCLSPLGGTPCSLRGGSGSGFETPTAAVSSQRARIFSAEAGMQLRMNFPSAASSDDGGGGCGSAPSACARAAFAALSPPPAAADAAPATPGFDLEGAFAFVAAGYFELAAADIDLGRMVATGAFAEVHEGRLTGAAARSAHVAAAAAAGAHAAGQCVAVKVQPIPPDPVEQANLLGELAVLKALCGGGKSERLVAYFGAAIVEEEPAKVHMVMELCVHGAVREALKLGLSWPLRVRIAQDVARALAVLAAHGVLHRDIKTTNVLLDAAWRAKLCDFNLAIDDASAAKLSHAAGTTEFMSPEALLGDDFSFPSDMFSYGVTLVEIITLRAPGVGDFLVRRPQELFVVNPDELAAARPHDVPASFWMLANDCCDPETEVRPDAEYAAQWLADILRDTFNDEVPLPQLQPEEDATCDGSGDGSGDGGGGDANAGGIHAHAVMATDCGGRRGSRRKLWRKLSGAWGSSHGSSGGGGGGGDGGSESSASSVTAGGGGGGGGAVAQREGRRLKGKTSAATLRHRTLSSVRAADLVRMREWAASLTRRRNGGGALRSRASSGDSTGDSMGRGGGGRGAGVRSPLRMSAFERTVETLESELSARQLQAAAAAGGEGGGADAPQELSPVAAPVTAERYQAELLERVAGLEDTSHVVSNLKALRHPFHAVQLAMNAAAAELQNVCKDAGLLLPDPRRSESARSGVDFGGGGGSAFSAITADRSGTDDDDNDSSDDDMPAQLRAADEAAGCAPRGGGGAAVIALTAAAATAAAAAAAAAAATAPRYGSEGGRGAKTTPAGAEAALSSLRGRLVALVERLAASDANGARGVGAYVDFCRVAADALGDAAAAAGAGEAGLAELEDAHAAFGDAYVEALAHMRRRKTM